MLAPVESPGVVSAWGRDDPVEQDFIRNMHGPGWHVNRARMDEMLCMDARSAGAYVSSGTRVVRVIPDSRHGWSLHTRDGTHAGGEKAKVVIDASGRNRRLLFRGVPRLVDDVLVAVTIRARGRGSGGGDLRTYVEAVPGGWWFSAPVPGDEGVAMFFTDLEDYRRIGVVLRDHLAHAPLTAARLAGAQLVETRVLYAPSARARQVCGPGWLAAGDAAASFDPMTGLGVLRAMEGALQAAAAADRFLDGDESGLAEYEQWVRTGFDAYRERRRLHYSSERRWPRAGFWRRRHQQVDQETQGRSPS